MEFINDDGDKVEAKTIYLQAYARDCFDMSISDENRNVLGEYQGYVPRILPGSGGDSLSLDIDIETGRILN